MGPLFLLSTRLFLLLRMKSVLFKIKDIKNPIEITFEEKFGLYKPVLKTSRKKYDIPLLLDNFQVDETINKINRVKKLKGCLGNIKLLKNVVAGAASLSIKKF